MGIRILVVDDHDVVRAGVRTILATRADWEVCGEATDGKMAVQMARELNPDLIVMDITMPVMSGLEAAREIAKCGLNSKVLVLSMHELHYKVEDFLKMGIHGYVPKSDAVRDLIRALDALTAGGTFLDNNNNNNNGTGRSAPQPSKQEGAMFRVALNWA
jgi:DNA-binding NarL/FixJ family response regulator